MAWLLTSLRQLRGQRSAAIGLACVVAVTAFVFAATPRLLDRVGDGALRDEVARAPGFARNVQLVQETIIAPGSADDQIEPVDEVGERLAAGIPARVRGLFGERVYVADSGRFTVQKELPDPTFMRLRIQAGLDDRIRYVEGRAPTAATRRIADPLPVPPRPAGTPVDDPRTPEIEGEAPPAPPGPLTVLEVALPVESARTLGASVGETVVLDADSRDPLVGRLPGGLHAAVEVVGIYEVLDEHDPYWVDDTALVRPSIRSPGGDAKLFDTTALVAPEAYGPLLRAMTGPEIPLPFRYTWRFLVLPERLSAANLDALVADLRRAEGLFAAGGGTSIDTERVALRTGLPALLEGYRARWRSAEAMLTVISVGPAVVATAAIALIAMLLGRRSLSSLSLWRGRGASRSQVLGAVGLEGLVLTIPAIALALVVAVALLPAGSNRVSVAAAVLVAALTTLLLVLAAAPATVGLPASARDVAVAGRPGPRRLVFELLVVTLAVAGVYLLRERGVAGASSTAKLTGADPFIAAVPLLAGLAAALIVVRLFPIPMRALALLAARRRDLVPVLALRRATNGGAGAAILLVLMTTASIGAFSSAALLHVDRTAEAAAWRTVGAPYRVTAASGALPPAFDAGAVPGVDRAAAAFRAIAPLGTRGGRMELLALDATDYAAVVAGLFGDPGLPPAILATGLPRVPAIISSSMLDRPDGLRPDTPYDTLLEGYHYDLQPIEVRDAFPTMREDQPFVIVSRDQLREVHDKASLATSEFFVRAPEGTGPALRMAADEGAPGATVDSAVERTAALRESPVRAAVATGVAIATLVAAAYAVLAVATALALAGASRAVEVAHLRTLGLSRRQATGLIVIEHGPTVVAAFAAGVGLGLALFVLLQPGLGFGTLVGTGLAVPLAVDLGQLAIVLVAIVVVVAVGMGLAAILQRNAATATAVRRGIE
jgi:putative ABC transport system permease protein